MKPIFRAILLMASINACKKTETVHVTQPDACFKAIVSDPFYNYEWPDTDPYQDFYYYFRNCSDSGEQVTYHWDFGDGAGSSEKSPKHIYPTRGIYKVALTVTSHNSVQDTEEQTIKVISGQRHLNLGDDISLVPVAIEETPANEFVVLGKEWFGQVAYLFHLDSLLRQKSMVTFPSGYSFNAMKPTTDGNYILAGSTREINKSNEMVKIKPDGSLVWNKILHEEDTYSYIAPAPGGGYYIVGTRPVADAYGNPVNFSLVIKTDDNGAEQWQKLFQLENMHLTSDAVIENDGIVVAGVKPGGVCNDCDSALIVKLGNDGNTIWASAMPWALSNRIMWDTRIARFTNGNYMVTNSALTGLLFISGLGQFLDRKLAPYQVHAVVPTPDGNFVNLMTGYGNGQYIYINKMTPDGFEMWNASPEERQKVPGGYSCCSGSWPVAIRPLRNGGTVIAGYRSYNNANSPGEHQVIVLIPLDDAGKLK